MLQKDCSGWFIEDRVEGRIRSEHGDQFEGWFNILGDTRMVVWN